MIASNAIVRPPAPTFANGVTTSAALGAPSYEKALRQHAAYVKALENAGVHVHTLPADDRFPDGCFVEDAVVLTEKVAIITRPGALSRREETKSIAQALRSVKPLAFIRRPGTLDGGDVLRIGDLFFIGLSKRTNVSGAMQLLRILGVHGYSCALVYNMPEALHLKSGIAYIGKGTLIGYREFQEHPTFKSFNLIPLPSEENYAANCILVNDTVVMAKGFPHAKAIIASLHDKVIELDVSEFEKMDGGLTCLSVLW